MAKVKLECIEADCDWVSQEVDKDLAKHQFDTHIRLKHMPVQPATPVMATLPESRPQAERVKRPSLRSQGKHLNRRIISILSTSLISTKAEWVKPRAVKTPP